jgi:glycosyltransferase involved in cell wall biosynthesis
VNRRFLRAYESNCAGFGASLFCTDKDKDKLKMAAPRVSDNGFVVPNVYPQEAFSTHDFGDGFLKPNTILFVGDLRYEPNVTGLMWFVDEVYPHLRRKHADVKLLIAGRAPSDAVSSLQQKGLNIEVRADAPDLKPVYEGCRAVVVPVLVGGGTRIKILEAALANRPVLSTSKGAEGLDLHDGVGLHLFQTADEFIEKYEQLNDASAYRAMAENARKTVLSRYTAKAFNEAMAKVLAYVYEKNS